MSDLIEYIYFEDDDIHKFIWHSKDRRVAAEYIAIFKDVHDAQPENSQLRILHDFSETGAPPVNAVLQSLKGFQQRSDVVQFIAHLYSDAMFPIIMQNVGAVNRLAVNRKFFKADEEQSAIEWLINPE